MKRILAIIAIATALVAGAEAPIFNGRSGKALRDAVAATCRPVTLVDAVFPETFALLDGGKPLSRFHDRAPNHFTTVIPPEWWEIIPCSYGDTLSRDLHNLVPCDLTVPPLKGLYPPGRVDGETGDEEWCHGDTYVDGYPAGCWMPMARWRGDIARTFFYIATVYPSEYWHPMARLLLDNNDFPALSAYAVDVMMGWSREDPVDDLERSRNEVIRSLQGNGNPFVDYPELAEHLWGTAAGQPLVIPGLPTPLRGTYTLSDGWVDLISPYIPDTALWSVDGIQTEDRRIATEDLGVGLHTLRYNCPDGSRGTIMIRITP